ncbi:24963_t:CDS:2 [Cetraspora pellucida]|uniref:acireductone dioxygenase (Fe(2+)-requiring) n=1 Tax=Cetraspora pellucida TaxID=1433469 RepID=A0A9N8ZWC1_9GLOM|nr:24963_t:CDS:2 [Cetraspora pellucida]
MRAYYYDNNGDIDPREPHEQAPLTLVTPEDLENLGVLYWQLSDNYPSEIDDICIKRSYKNRDELTCSREGLGDAYESKLKTFFEEYDDCYIFVLLKNFHRFAYVYQKIYRHLHEDEEIRFVVDGSGYFDVRDRADRWIRLAVSKGDLIVLVRIAYGIY